MSLQFSRSIHSLKFDSYQASRIGMILAVMVAAALLIWLFFARITLYETSADIQFNEKGYLMAGFPPETVERIQPGQSAIVRLNLNSKGETISLPALVIDAQAQHEQVSLIITLDDLPERLLLEKPNGQVNVEIDHVKPIDLLMRSYAQGLNNTQLPLSPQGLQDADR